MVLEVAQITVLPGHEEQFAQAFRSARHLLEETEGFQSVRMTRGIESPSRFVMLIEWDSVEAHQLNFRAAPRFLSWRAAIGPHFDGAPDVQHYCDI